MKNQFYGNGTDTILVSSKGIFLIASQDRVMGGGEYERLLEMPPGVVPISSAVMDQDMLEELPDELFD